MFLIQAFRRAAQTRGAHTATVDGDERQTWRETAQRVSKLAGGLAQLETQPGDRIAILSLNSTRFFEAYFSVFWLGAVCVPLNTRWSTEELVYALNDTESVILFTERHFIGMIDDLRSRCKSIRHVVMMNGDDASGGLLIAYDAMLQAGERIEPVTVSGDALAVISYTGGTTGQSKGVMHSHLSIWSGVLAFGHDFHNFASPDTVSLISLPMFHVGGTNPVFATVIGSGCCVFLPSFEPRAVIEVLHKEKITHLVLVPTTIRLLLDTLENDDHHSLAVKVLTYGGAPMTQAQIEETMRKLPGARMQQGYAQTEAVTVTMLGAEYHVAGGADSNRLRSVGRAGSSAETVITGPDGKELPRGKVGELRYRGPHMMMGYWLKPEQTADTIVDGWVRTGDVGYMDEEGFIFLVDRLKDMIVSGGENVYSAEVENALASHPAVATGVVIGIPDKRWGEAVHAIAMLREGHTATADEIIAHCRKLIAGFKCPRSVEFRTDPMPVSAAGKILKRELRQPYWKGRDSTLA